MDLDRLHEFIVAARLKSIRKAARAMDIAPATLSARLYSFEALLGTTLFERNHSALTLTPKGARFYIDACEIIEEYSQLKIKLAECSAPHRTLKIAVAAGIIPFYLTAFLAALETQSPGLNLELWDDTCCSVSDGLLSGQVDFYFAPVMAHFKYEEIVCQIIAPSRPQVLLPPNHRFASRGSISMKELENECFILYPVTKETCVRDFQIENLKASGIAYSIYDSNSLPVFNQTLSAVGKGIFISPIPLLNNLPDSVHIPLTGIRRPAVETLFYRKNSDNPDIDFFAAQFKQHIKEFFGHENRKTL